MSRPETLGDKVRRLERFLAEGRESSNRQSDLIREQADRIRELEATDEHKAAVEESEKLDVLRAEYQDLCEASVAALSIGPVAKEPMLDWPDELGDLYDALPIEFRKQVRQ